MHGRVTLFVLAIQVPLVHSKGQQALKSCLRLGVAGEVESGVALLVLVFQVKIRPPLVFPGISCENGQYLYHLGIIIKSCLLQQRYARVRKLGHVRAHHHRQELEQLSALLLAGDV
jgi:hypothetical protein